MAKTKPTDAERMMAYRASKGEELKAKERERSRRRRAELKAKVQHGDPTAEAKTSLQTAQSVRRTAESRRKKTEARLS